MRNTLIGLPTVFSTVQEARLFSELLTAKTLVLAHTVVNLQSNSAGTTPDIDMETLYAWDMGRKDARWDPKRIIGAIPKLPLRNT
jgi:hypothetical protein